MRTLVDIPDEDLKVLKRLSKARQVSRAQLVRTAISAYLNSQTDDAMHQAFGLWSKDAIAEDGLAYQERMRNEW